jgi:mycofactocin glycosyltransferase
MSTPTSARNLAIPPGTRLVADESLRQFQGGRILLGGSPTRTLTLSPAGSALFRRWLAGEPVPQDPLAEKLARRLLDAGLVHPRLPAEAYGCEDVTLVVPVRDNPAGTARLLDATRELGRCIVVDDGSTTTLASAEVRHSRARGPAAARNTGWRLARTGLVAFLDSDTAPEPGWLEEILPYFGDPLVVAVAPRVRSFLATPSSPLIERYESDFSSLDMGNNPAAVRPLSRISYVPAAALVVRRSALSDVDGFDEDLRFGEDVDLVWRLIDHGGTVRYEPRATVWHQPRGSLRAWLRQRFEYGTAAAPLARRHPDKSTCALMSRWSALTWALVASGRSLAALAVTASSAGLLMRKLRNIPMNESLALVVRGNLGAGHMLARATRRGWWPLALLTRHGRRLLLASVAAGVCEVITNQERLDPAAWLLTLAEDLAYSAGVWAGCLRHRTFAPLIPQLTDSPRRRR